MTTRVDFFIPQGTDWSEGMNFTNDDNSPVNLTGYNLFGSVKASFYSNNVIANLTLVVLNAAAGNAAISLNAATTSNMSAGKYVYTVDMLDNVGFTTRVLDGILTIRASTLVNPPNNGEPSNG